jgi:hypothetical protein
VALSSDEAFLVTLLRALRQSKLEAVIVGNTAAVLQGAPVTTQDIDILVRDSKLTSAKVEDLAQRLGAFRTRPSELVDITTLLGASAPVDVIVGHIAGDLRFESVKSRARVISVAGEDALVADLADIIRSKEAANREKDRAVLPMLRATLAVREGC